MLYPGKPKEIYSDSNFFIEKSLDPEWVAEPKWNGWRAFLLSDEIGKITAYNSKGTILSYFKTEGIKIPPLTYLDAEWVEKRTTNVKNKLVVFGILQYDGKILNGKEAIRRAILEDLFSEKLVTSTGVEMSLVQRFSEDFLTHFTELRDEKVIEGLVLKKITAELEYSVTAQFKSFTQLKVKK